MAGERSEDRPRGILSKTDRDYLNGAPGSGKEASRRIRERIENAILDFKLLNSCIDRYAKNGDPLHPIDFGNPTSKIEEQSNEESEDRFRRGFISALEYIYRLSLRSSFDFDVMLESAIRRVDPYSTIEINVNRNYDFETAMKKWENDQKQQLTVPEITLLSLKRPGHIEEEDYEEFYEELHSLLEEKSGNSTHIV